MTASGERHLSWVLRNENELRVMLHLFRKPLRTPVFEPGLVLGPRKNQRQPCPKQAPNYRRH